ncbi:broad specificity phosphatase PhoE [Erwinia toletana]|uniref:Broad specificity phosphatase PhoE n=1 Tax=Winslowiella toletana TaxID=92490 RepID=A0ABS4PAG4_9GAMM|nr:histidine phosphatase family protein [Winslowiella toletana]MBP2169624.1 broad specificity phosphatase PhoE [Winslowiella toletana]
MAIILMRHGKPDHQSPARVSALAMEQWCEQYNLSLVSDLPPDRSRMIARQANVIVTSTLPRALSSLEKLGMQADTSDALYSEVELPILPFSAFHLPPAFWLSFWRLLWFCGYSGSVESFKTASARAKQAAQQLIALSEQGTVLLVGHGIMNKMIARELRKRGWQAEKHASSRHWSTAIYNRPFI